MEQELRQLIGDKPYEYVAEHCRKRAQLPADFKQMHPATVLAAEKEGR